MTIGTETNPQLDELTLALRHLQPVLARIVDLVQSAEGAPPGMAQLGQQLERIAAGLEGQNAQTTDLRTEITRMAEAMQRTQEQLDAISKRFTREAQGRARLEEKIDALLAVLKGPA